VTDQAFGYYLTPAAGCLAVRQNVVRQNVVRGNIAFIVLGKTSLGKTLLGEALLGERTPYRQKGIDFCFHFFCIRKADLLFRSFLMQAKRGFQKMRPRFQI
jgi:hypothetical protein